MVAAVGEKSIQAALAAVESLLERRVGTPVSLDEVHDLGGSGRTLVMRVRVVDNNSVLPRSAVIKQLRLVDHSHRGHAEAFARESAAYKFATALPVQSRPGPQLLASDPDAKVLVLQDLGEGETMTDVLGRTPSAAAPIVLSAWAQALGRMHAGTYGREADFSALARHENTDSRNDPIADEYERAATAVTNLVGGVDDSSQALLDAAGSLFDEGSFRAFSPSDVGPDNTHVVGGAVRFLDYEWAGFRDAALDLAYVLLTYPGCTPTGRRDEFDDAIVEAWRSEVVRLWPRLADDVALHRHVATAQLAWLIVATYWQLGLDSTAAPVSHIDIGHLDNLVRFAPGELVERWEVLAESEPRIAVFARAAAAQVRRT